MIELDLLTKDVNAFPGLNLNNIVTVLPLFFLATVRVGQHELLQEKIEVIL